MKAIPFLRPALTLVLSLPLLCQAALGDKAASVQTDQQKMRASSSSIRNTALYRVHEMQNESGTVVREYESLDGTIFAVTWTGPTKPDLKQLFGQYFDRYQTRDTDGRRNASFHDRDLVVQSTGHLRAFSGIAYLPQLVPVDVNVDELP